MRDSRASTRREDVDGWPMTVYWDREKMGARAFCALVSVGHGTVAGLAND